MIRSDIIAIVFNAIFIFCDDFEKRPWMLWQHNYRVLKILFQTFRDFCFSMNIYNLHYNVGLRAVELISLKTNTILKRTYLSLPNFFQQNLIITTTKKKRFEWCTYGRETE